MVQNAYPNAGITNKVLFLCWINLLMGKLLPNRHSNIAIIVLFRLQRLTDHPYSFVAYNLARAVICLVILTFAGQSNKN